MKQQYSKLFRYLLSIFVICCSVINAYSLDIYFKNTLNWGSVYVYLYNNDCWNNDKGATGKDVKAFMQLSKEGQDGGKDVYHIYYNGSHSGYIAFTEGKQDGYDNFYATKAAYRGDYDSSKPMFVPNTTSNGTWNNTTYYSNGEWSTYSNPDCTVQAKGSDISAGAIVYFDNSDHIYSGTMHVSVPKDATNGNATSVNQGSYIPKNDNWYIMYQIEGTDYWMAEIKEASSYGRLSFWKNADTKSDQVWQQDLVFQVPYTAGKMYKPDKSKDCYNSDRQTHVYMKGEWVGKPVGIKADHDEPYTFGEEIVLSADGGTSPFKWYSSKNGTSYTQIGSGESVKIELEEPTYYKCVDANNYEVVVLLRPIVICKDESSKTRFSVDFGKFTEEKARKQFSDFTGENYSGKCSYGYVSGCGAVKDGDKYAIVPTGKYCGYGELAQGADACSPGSNRTWFRQIYDHTIGDAGASTGEYGGMLLVNCGDASDTKYLFEYDLIYIG